MTNTIARLRKFIDDHARTTDGHQQAIGDLDAIVEELAARLERQTQYPTQWECQVVAIAGDIGAALNKMGEEGWELRGKLGPAPKSPIPGQPADAYAFQRPKRLIAPAPIPLTTLSPIIKP